MMLNFIIAAFAFSRVHWLVMDSNSGDEDFEGFVLSPEEKASYKFWRKRKALISNALNSDSDEDTDADDDDDDDDDDNDDEDEDVDEDHEGIDDSDDKDDEREIEGLLLTTRVMHLYETDCCILLIMRQYSNIQLHGEL